MEGRVQVYEFAFVVFHVFFVRGWGTGGVWMLWECVESLEAVWVR